MSDIKSLFENAKAELDADSQSPLRVAIKEIIKLERHYYYADRNKSSRLKELREIVLRHADGEEFSDAD